MGRVLGALCLTGMVVAANSLAADAAADAARAELVRERKRLVADVRNLSDVTRRLENALGALASAARSVADVSARADAGPDEIARREDALSTAEQESHALL